MKKILIFFSNAIFIVSLLFSGFLLLSKATSLPLPKAFLVSSGSMEPAIKTGSLVFTMPQKNYAVGDVVTFKPDPKNKSTTTHRVVAIGGGIVKTAGDANNSPDPRLINLENVVGKVFYVLPYLGYLAGFIQTPQGFILFVIVPATILIYEEFKSLFIELKNNIKKRAGKMRTGAQGVPPAGKVAEHLQSYFPNALLFVIPLLFAGLVITVKSNSFFSDVETSSQNSFTANWIPEDTPTPTPKAGDVVINEINWAGSAASGADEWVELRNTTSRTIILDNWVVQNLGGGGPNANITIPSGSIGAGQFFLIANYAETDTHTKLNTHPNFISTGISLNDNGEQLTLKDNTNQTIDVANGTGSWFTGQSSSPKKSMERTDTPGDGTLSTSWQTPITHTNLDPGSLEFATPKWPNGI